MHSEGAWAYRAPAGTRQHHECYDEHGVRHAISEPPPPEESGLEIVNSWWNSRCQLTIFVVKDKQGRAQLRVGCEDRLTFTIRTLDAAAVWPVEAERKAQERLAGLIPADAFELYDIKSI